MKKQFTLILMLFAALFVTQNVCAQEDDGKKDPGLAFDKEHFDYVIGQGDFVEPKLINPNHLPVYFISDNASAASVDYATGEVTIITQGVVTITVCTDETEEFKAGFARYTINITDNALIYEASFITGEDGFTEQSTSGVSGVWTHESDGYMKADAFSMVEQVSEFYLVSPEFTLSETGNVASFGECGSYFKSWEKEAQLLIRENKPEAEWIVLDRNYLSGDQYRVVSTGDIKIPNSLNGKKVVVAFKYTSDGNKMSGVWHIRNFQVKSAASSKLDAKLSFEKNIAEYIFGSGDTFVAPKLINPNNLEVKYSSDNEAVATVDEITGEVKILSLGTAIITATSEATSDYEVGKASYKLRVKDESEANFSEPTTRSPMLAIMFSGQKCGNCHGQESSLEEAQKKYGKENYIIATLHPSEKYSNLGEGHPSLYNADAYEYSNSIGIKQTLPQVVYNTLGTEKYNLTIDQMLKSDDFLECTGNVTYNTNDEYKINIKTRLRTNQKEFAKDKNVDIILWVLENGVVALQSIEGQFVNPEHNHVFRGCINSLWGDAYEVGTAYNKCFEVPLTVDKAENTEVVALFVDHDSKLVLDAACFTPEAEDPAGISEVNAEEKNSPVYSINGMRVQTLVKGGLYIKNGRKFIAR